VWNYFGGISRIRGPQVPGMVSRSPTSILS
jgi:hypothetical protein